MADAGMSPAVSEPADNVLHVRWSPFESVAHIVNSSTIAEAEAADAAPVYEDFGDLRRNDLDELVDRLDSYGSVELDDYISEIERSAGREPTGTTPTDRLAALADVTFDGTDDLPADAEDFRPDWEAENAPAEEFRGYDIIAKAMSNDLPRDLFDEFARSRSGDSPAFSEHIDDSVSSERLDELIVALEARGYVVVRE